MRPFKLSDLGRYKIDRADDYKWAKSAGEDITYYEMIRVKGSKPDKRFQMPSHLYKYSETELALYFKDHKNYWKPISAFLGVEINLNADEALFRFKISQFPEISKIAKFTMKRGGVLSNKFIMARGESIKKIHVKTGQNAQKKNVKTVAGVIMPDRLKGVKNGE